MRRGKWQEMTINEGDQREQLESVTSCSEDKFWKLNFSSFPQDRVLKVDCSSLPVIYNTPLTRYVL